MPEMTGVELLKKLRERGVQTPALFLTAHDQLEDKVAGFEAGADDYLSKPFSPREVEYRVAALLRRGQLSPAGTDDDRMAISDRVLNRRMHQESRSLARGRRTHLGFQNPDLLPSTT